MLLSKKIPTANAASNDKILEHPFLLVRKSDYAGLQSRADRWPWSEQVEAALHDVETLQYFPDSRIDIRSINLARIFSTTALAYVLDPTNRKKYVARIVEHLQRFDPAVPGNITSEIRANANKTLWIYGVPTGNAFFQGVLALDLVHDDLPPKQRVALEAMLRDGPARYFRETPLAWRQGSHAAAAIWPLYEGDSDAYLPIVDEWVRHTLVAISADGVFVGGAGYADARWSFADREHKSLFGDVLVHAGVLPDWYAEPKVAKFQEWLNGYAYTPFRVLWTFGDSGPERFNGMYQPGSERASRYSSLAGRYAAWLRDGVTPPGAFASYVLADEDQAEPEAAPSRVFADGGAWLKEASLDWRALSGALWNLADAKDAHAHKETNSVCIAAYGEMLLRAGGYNGWATPEQGFSWEYIHDRAIAGNTALFDYPVPASPEEERSPSATNDHVLRHGAGITASLLTGVVDFAYGDSGEAIPNGHHGRNFLFVHPRDGANGYYVVFDELAAAAGSTAQIAWHPASSRCTATAEREQCTWLIKEFGNRDVGLTIFMATQPDVAVLRDGILANWGHGVVAKYLVGHYPIDASGQRTVATILFPHDAEHPLVQIERIDRDQMCGAKLRLGAWTDTVFESKTIGPIELVAGLLVQASAGYLRQKSNNTVATAWLKDAVLFSTEAFEIASTSPSTMFFCDDDLRFLVQIPTRIMMRCGSRFSLRAKSKVLCDSGPAGRIEIDLPVGEHAFRIAPR